MFPRIRVVVAIIAAASAFSVLTLSPASADTLLPPYKQTLYTIRDLPDTQRPYYAPGAGPLDGPSYWHYDSQGVYVHIINGVAYDHPVMQAQFMLTRLNSYAHNLDPVYLSRVKANAQRLMDIAVTSRGAAYLPYRFSWQHGGVPLNAPWYSAMAQGQALSAFVRLYQVTGEQRYRDFADALFASFQNSKAYGVPWTVNVDSAGYLWLQEYPTPDGGDGTFNGHIFALYGLYDYYSLTGNPAAKSLLKGALSSVAAYVGQIRNAGWKSLYCLKHFIPQAEYHSIHVAQLYMLSTITGAEEFAQWADRFLEDFPAAQLGGRGYLAGGAQNGLKVDSSGAVTATKSITLPGAEAVTIGSRLKIAGQRGIWLRVDSGTASGYWVRETLNRAFVKLAIENYTYPVRWIRFAVGQYTGYQFNALGLRSSSKVAYLAGASAAHTDQREVMNGVLYFHVTDGIWKDYWIPALYGVTLQSSLSFAVG